LDPDDPHNFAWLDQATWYHYVEGYGTAARLVVDEIISDEGVMRSAGDQLVFPAVFLYRQYLELLMKRFIVENGARVSQSDEYPRHHDLQALWKRCQGIIAVEWPPEENDDDREIAEGITSLIDQLVAIDAGSFAFRYPEQRDGTKSLPADLRSFNVGIFADRIEAIGNLLEGLSMGLDYHASLRAEMAEAMAHRGWT
jgi:hypothetical protein